MEYLITMDYSQLRYNLANELSLAAQSFVKIGYFLRIARDTDSLKGSGYSNVNEFAKSEFGLDASQVSRFIRINERFGAGGELQEHYNSFGSSKLAEMLMLPDTVAEEVPAAASKAEIRALAQDLAEDAKTTDLEIAMEDHSQEPVVLQFFREYFKTRPEEYVEIAGKRGKFPTIALADTLAPSGISLKVLRLTGIGKVSVNFRNSRPVSILAVRTGEKWEMELSRLSEEISPLFEPYADLPPRSAWELLYQQPYQGELTAGGTEKEMAAAEAGKEAAVEKAEEGEAEEKAGHVQPENEPEGVQADRNAGEAEDQGTEGSEGAGKGTPEDAEKPEEVHEKTGREAAAGKRGKRTVIDLVDRDRKTEKAKPRKAAGESTPEPSSSPVFTGMNPPETPEEATEKPEEKPGEIVTKPEETVTNPEETAEKAEETGTEAGTGDDPAGEASVQLTRLDVITNELWRLHLMLKTGIEEKAWHRCGGILGRMKEYITQALRYEEEQDTAQMDFGDFPELMPGTGEEEAWPGTEEEDERLTKV